MDRSTEFAIKIERVEAYMKRVGLGGMLLGRSDNFAWLGCGADNVVNSAQETGVGALVVQFGRVTLVANNIETERLLTEELAGLGISDTATFPWHEPAKRDQVVKQLAGGSAFAVDDGSGGMAALPEDFVRLRYGLTRAEVDRYAALGADAGAALEAAARSVRQGMTEADVAGLVAGQCRRAGIAPVVLLVAADDRIRSWRHPIVKDAVANRCAMLVICGRRAGLVAAATRLVHFGQVPEDLARRHRAVCAVDAAMMAATEPGVRAGSVFAAAQEAYAEQGFEGEWQHHHQGGAIGYLPREYIATAASDKVVVANQAFAWNPSIRGTKSEDTVLITESGPELLTRPGEGWPTVEVALEDFGLPRADILVL